MSSGGVPGKSTVSTYGAPFVDAYPVTNGATDQDAAAANQMMADVAAMTRTGCRAWVRFVLAASTGALALASVNSYDSMWGANPLNLVPVFTRAGTGSFNVTWAGTTGGVVYDEYNVQQPLNFQRGLVVLEGALTNGGPVYSSQVGSMSANSINFYVFSVSAGVGTFADAVGTIAHVMVF